MPQKPGGLMRSFNFRRRGYSVVLAAMIAGWGLPDSLHAQSEKESVIPVNQITGPGGHQIVAHLLKPGDSAKRTRQDAIEQIPMKHLTPAGQQTVNQILKDLSLYRRMPTLEVDVDRRAYHFFTEHPDVAVSIWRALQISHVEMTEVNPQYYKTDTRDGTVGTVEVLLRSPDSYLVLCQGQLQSPGMLKPIQAKALMHLQPRFDQAGKVVHTLDMFVAFPSQTVETIARLTSPVSFRIADRNFEEVSLFMALMSSSMANQPGWVEQVAKRMEGVPAERPQDLLKVTASIYVDAEKKRLTALGQPVNAESILPPVQTASGQGESPLVR